MLNTFLNICCLFWRCDGRQKSAAETRVSHQISCFTPPKATEYHRPRLKAQATFQAKSCVLVTWRHAEYEFGSLPSGDCFNLEGQSSMLQDRGFAYFLHEFNHSSLPIRAVLLITSYSRGLAWPAPAETARSPPVSAEASSGCTHKVPEASFNYISGLHAKFPSEKHVTCRRHAPVPWASPGTWTLDSS